MKSITMSFYSPLKPVDSQVPSGDREISRGLLKFFEKRGVSPFIASRLVGRRRQYRGSLYNGLKTLTKIIPAWTRTIAKRPHVLFTYHNYYKAPDWVHPVVSWLTRKPYVVFEASLKPSLRKSDPFYFHFINFSFKRAQLLFTDVKRDYEILKRYYPNKTHYIKPSVIIDKTLAKQPRQPNRPIQLISIAMLRSHKKYPSILWLVETLSELQKSGLSFHYQHVGGGENLIALKKLCSKLLDAGTYTIHGTMTKEQVNPLLQQSDLFVYPGIGESFGMVYLEAQAQGLPVIAFNNGGIAEAVCDQRTGYLCEPFNRVEYKKRILELNNSPEQMAKMSKQAISYVQAEHNQNTNYGRMLDLIQQSLTNV